MLNKNPIPAGPKQGAGEPTGQFIEIDGDRYYCIRNVDRMPPFFMSVVSSADHWLFISSTGGLTAGRVAPDYALFPYVTVDKIHDSTLHTGCRTLVRGWDAGKPWVWEPFNPEHGWRYTIERHLYKSILGTRLRFEEINHSLGLTFRYTWETSDEFGFVRSCELENKGKDRDLEILDGFRNILPAGTPAHSQAMTSNLVDAYKWSELDEASGLGAFTLYAGISDRAEPKESLRANVAFSLGLTNPTITIASDQIDRFRAGEDVDPTSHTRGVRGAYFVNAGFSLAQGESSAWQLVADVELTQGDVLQLQRRLREQQTLARALRQDIETGNAHLTDILANSDGLQATGEAHVGAHHLANVLFNVLRGGTFNDNYAIETAALKQSVRHFNHRVFGQAFTLLDGLPAKATLARIIPAIRESGDKQLERLCCEYLPLTFGRRHGDPSRPWNQFSIKLKDESGAPRLSYEGNWRDIFQNWEALLMSFPEFIESTIAKFVNASTIDGHNPYRITNEGIDWEIEDSRDPWSYIGYWGDHQIIYLLKLLELSEHFHPNRLRQLLTRTNYCYANVPYRVKPFEQLLEDPKSTVQYDAHLDKQIHRRVQDMGADGRLLLDDNGEVYLVNLVEKLLVPLLAKLGNLVVGGGIWMNTQRPEWNDANNALVGHGLSMVTLYYLRRYVQFLQRLLADIDSTTEVSCEVLTWLRTTLAALENINSEIDSGDLTPAQRFTALAEVGKAASNYRETVYSQGGFSGTSDCGMDEIQGLLDAASRVIDYSIRQNRRDDGLYHAYNLLIIEPGELEIEKLYQMLEGQVAVLSSGTLDAVEVTGLLRALFSSKMYRDDQDSFMLYPDRPLPGFLEKNIAAADKVEAIPLLADMVAKGDTRIVAQDVEGNYRFNADFGNVKDLEATLTAVTDDYGAVALQSTNDVLELFESVFHHHAFTGRSGTMFGFEGLGCIYWHMVAKLLVAIQENYFRARDEHASEGVTAALARAYYEVRQGLGFNKTPTEYGAFPADPYSHTPGHAGAQQPGMTGQVKEEILARFGELGVRVLHGRASFDTSLLRLQEFRTEPGTWHYLNVDGEWQTLELPVGSLAFTWCQVPVIYELSEHRVPEITVTWRDGFSTCSDQTELDEETSSAIFTRSGQVREILLRIPRHRLADID